MVFIRLSLGNFNHHNIIKYCSRPFKDIEEMNNAIITRHNTIVGENDIVICLGDVSFHNGMEFISKMNGNFICIKGNHDDKEYRSQSLARIDICYKKYKFLCCHDPRRIFGKYTLNIVGHVHNQWKFKKDRHLLNVSVDVWDFKPVSLEDVIKYCH